jgi:hypothetical protein
MAEGQGRRYPLNMRTTSGLRDKIAEAARLSGRSMSHEVEARLEESFTYTEVRQAVIEGFSIAQRAREDDIIKSSRDRWIAEELPRITDRVRAELMEKLRD